MRALIGAVLVAFGVLLVVFGLDSTECLTTRISKVIHATPGSNPVFLWGGGIVIALLGMAIAYDRRGHGSRS